MKMINALPSLLIALIDKVPAFVKIILVITKPTCYRLIRPMQRVKMSLTANIPDISAAIVQKVTRLIHFLPLGVAYFLLTPLIHGYHSKTGKGDYARKVVLLNHM